MSNLLFVTRTKFSRGRAYVECRRRNASGHYVHYLQREVTGDSPDEIYFNSLTLADDMHRKLADKHDEQYPVPCRGCGAHPSVCVEVCRVII